MSQIILRQLNYKIKAINKVSKSYCISLNKTMLQSTSCYHLNLVIDQSSIFITKTNLFLDFIAISETLESFGVPEQGVAR